MKRMLMAILLLISILLLIGGFLLFRQYHEWLGTRGLDRLIIVLLGSFGLAIVTTQIVLWRAPRETSRGRFISSYLRVMAQIFAIFAGIFITLIFFGFLLDLMQIYPLIILPALFLLLPLGLIVIDMFQGKASRTPRNLLVGYGYYSYDVLYLLLAQLILIPVLFFIGPMGIFLIFISIVDMVFRLIPSLEAAPVPIICYWSGIGQPYCTPSLLLLSLLYLLLLFMAVRYGNRVIERLSAGYHWGKERLSSSIRREE